MKRRFMFSPGSAEASQPSFAALGVDPGHG